MLSDVKLCVANKDGSFQAVRCPAAKGGDAGGASGSHQRMLEEDLPELLDGGRRHYPGCASPWKES